MAGRRSTGRRRRPGRRPPHRYRGRGGGGRPRGFTGPGFLQIFDLMMSGLVGRQRRVSFDQAGGWMVLGCGLGGCRGWRVTGRSSSRGWARAAALARLLFLSHRGRA